MQNTKNLVKLITELSFFTLAETERPYVNNRRECKTIEAVFIFASAGIEIIFNI